MKTGEDWYFVMLGMVAPEKGDVRSLLQSRLLSREAVNENTGAPLQVSCSQCSVSWR